MGEDVGGYPEETMNKTEKLNALEVKKVEMKELQNQFKEVQKRNEKQEVANSFNGDLEKQCKAEIKKELDKVLPSAVEQGLRDLPFQMVCAYQDQYIGTGVINYDRTTVEFNNSDRPGGADGWMDIETGVFTAGAVTSGYYIITFSTFADVHVEETTSMYLYHNGVQVEESLFSTKMGVGSGYNYMFDQGSKTVILHLLGGDTLDLRTVESSYRVRAITLCLYMA